MAPNVTFSSTSVHDQATGYVNHTLALGFLDYYFNPVGGFQVMAFGGIGQVLNAYC